MSVRRHGILLAMGLAHSLNHSLLVLFPPLIPIILATTDISIQTLGIISTIGFATWGVGALAGGVLADRFGEYRMIALSMGLSGGSSLVIWFMPNEIGLALGFFLIGAWGSLYHPSANSLISKLFSDRTASAMGIHGALGHIGQIITPVLSVVIALAFGWSNAFLLYGIIAMITSLLFVSPRPRTIALTKNFLADLRKTVKIRSLWFLFAFDIFAALTFRAMDFIFPIYLVAERAFSIEAAGLAASILLSFGVLGQLVGGKPTDRIGSKRMLQISAVGTVMGISAILIIEHPLLALATFIVVYGILHYANQPAAMTYTAEVTTMGIRGIAYGLFFTIGSTVGSSSGVMAGFLAETYSPAAAIGMALVFASIALVVTFLIPDARKIAGKALNTPA